MRAYDLSRYQRLIGVDGGRITGTFWVTMPVGEKDRGVIVQTVDVRIWDEERYSGRILSSRDLSATVKDGEVDLREHMIASVALADVQDVWDEMRAVLAAVADEALAWTGGDSDA